MGITHLQQVSAVKYAKLQLEKTHIAPKLHIEKMRADICKSEHVSHVAKEKEHAKKRLAVLSWLIAALGIFMNNVLYQCSEDAEKYRVRERMQQLDKKVEADIQRMLAPHISPP